MGGITVSETVIEEAVKVNSTITEFDENSFDKNYFEQRYADKKHLILVAYIEDNPVGYAVSYDRDSDKSFYCWMAGVNPEHRRKGVLTKIMQHLESWCRENNYNKLRIKTRNNRREMLSYLVSNGFFLTKVIPKENISETRICLEKQLS